MTDCMPILEGIISLQIGDPDFDARFSALQAQSHSFLAFQRVDRPSGTASSPSPPRRSRTTGGAGTPPVRYIRYETGHIGQPAPAEVRSEPKASAVVIGEMDFPECFAIESFSDVSGRLWIKVEFLDTKSGELLSGWCVAKGSGGAVFWQRDRGRRPTSPSQHTALSIDNLDERADAGSGSDATVDDSDVDSGLGLGAGDY